ncbi:MAG: Ig-like domain-containing protein [Bacilli bacterium]|nr:Ig-like domain-containing protein [Bacilli bacterium]
MKIRNLIALFFAIGILTSCSGGTTNNEPSTPVTPSGPTTEDPTEHEHTFESDWSHDDEHHWHNSTCGHDVVSNKDFHKFSWKTIIEPTEQNEGVERGTCDICKYQKERTIEKLEHVHQSGSPVVSDYIEATCTKDGSYVETVYCSACGDIVSQRTVTIPALGHNIVHDNGIPESCTEPWYGPYDYCTRCDYSTKVVVDPLGHIAGEAERSNETESTCTEEGGYDLITRCVRCHEIINTEHKTIPALGHDLVHHEETDSSCTEHGHYAYDSCSRCDYTTEIIEKDLIPHNVWLRTTVVSYPKSYQKGTYNYWFKCYECGQTISSGNKRETGSSTHLKFNDADKYGNLTAIVGGKALTNFENTSSFDVEWVIGNTDVLSKNNNNEIMAISTGYSMLYAFTQGREVAAVYVCVVADELTLKLPQSDFYPGDSFEVGFETFTRNDRSILSWSSSDESIATVDENGQVEVVGIGTVSITAYSTTYGLEDTISFTSKKHFGVLKRTTLNIGRAEYDTIFERYSRIDIFQWTSSDPTIASASGNVLTTYNKYGTVTLTATSDYLDEAIVMTVNVVEVTATLSKSNYKNYLDATISLEKVSASVGYNWNVIIEIEMKSLWYATTDITFSLEFSYSCSTIPSGTKTVNVKITKDSTISNSVYVIPTSYNENPLTGVQSQPSYTITSVGGSIKK